MSLATVTQAEVILMVTVDGAQTPSRALRLDSYQPTLGDRVVVMTVGARLLVLGKVV